MPFVSLSVSFLRCVEIIPAERTVSTKHGKGDKAVALDPYINLNLKDAERPEIELGTWLDQQAQEYRLAQVGRVIGIPPMRPLKYQVFRVVGSPTTTSFPEARHRARSRGKNSVPMR